MHGTAGIVSATLRGGVLSRRSNVDGGKMVVENAHGYGQRAIHRPGGRWLRLGASTRRSMATIWCLWTICAEERVSCSRPGYIHVDVAGIEKPLQLICDGVWVVARVFLGVIFEVVPTLVHEAAVG